MKKIITAIGNPILNEELKKEKNIEVIGSDIQYQEGIFELLEKIKDVDFIIISEIIKGEESIDKIVEKIKLINKKIKIIIVLEKSKEDLENLLIAKGIFKILYNNQIEIKNFINLINENNEKEELKQEIDNLKKLIIENQKLNQIKLSNEKINEEINQEKINDKKLGHEETKLKNNADKFLGQEKFYKKINSKFFQKINPFNLKCRREQLNKLENEKEIISISGPSGVGKSIVSINLAKAMVYKKKKILMIDFDILGNSLHTILGVKKYPSKKVDKINYNNEYNLEIRKFITKVTNRIDLISATDLLFGTRGKIDISKIEKILNKLKQEYNTIIIDTSSECFFDFTKTIIKLSNKNIFVTETNILEIKKAKELLKIYINEWKIDKNKFNVLFNKYDKDCISIQLLKELFCEFNILGFLKYNSKYNKLINQNNKYQFINKDIRNEYLKVNEKIS